LRPADVLIVLLTPRWIESAHCRKEFMVFEELEASRLIGKSVASILARSITQQERHLTREQRDILNRIRQRQHFEVVAAEFLGLPRARRNAEIEKIAEHIAGVIEQLRDLPRSESPAAAENQATRESEPFAERGLGVRGPVSRTSDMVADSDLPDLAVFRDGPFAPEMVCSRRGDLRWVRLKTRDSSRKGRSTG
jgi:hypothetical protein